MESNTISYAFDMMERGLDFSEALKSGDVDAVKIALQENSFNELNDRDAFDRTPLHVASCRGFLDIVKVLCDAGADTNALDQQGNTSLHWCGHVEIAEHLLAHGADAATLNKMDMTPWQLAERRGVSKNVVLFLKHHCELSKSRQNGAIGQTFPSVWQEFYHDIGLKNMFLLVFGLLCISLLLAYKLTGFPRHSEIKIPVDFQTKRFDI